LTNTMIEISLQTAMTDVTSSAQSAVAAKLNVQ
jgi:hypothetical protein